MDLGQHPPVLCLQVTTVPHAMLVGPRAVKAALARSRTRAGSLDCGSPKVAGKSSRVVSPVGIDLGSASNTDNEASSPCARVGRWVNIRLTPTRLHTSLLWLTRLCYVAEKNIRPP